MDLKLEQEDRFRLLVQAQDEDRRVLRSFLGREGTPAAVPSLAHVPLMKMGPQDDPEAFVDLFERTAEACGWERTQWPVRLIPLLTGEAQVAAQQLPVANLLAYDDLKRAVLQRVGRTPEQHRQRFRSRELGDSGRPFVMAQQLRDACRRWLLAEDRDVEAVVDLVVLEQFIARLPRGTAEWVRCHRPSSLTQAIQLAEDHLVACPGGGEPLFNLSLSSPSHPSPSRPIPVPRSRSNVPPRVPQRSGAFQGNRPGTREGAGATGPSAPFSSLHQSFGHPSAAGAAGRPGPACWRCGDPGHFLDRCPMMEVGALIRVPDSPAAAPDQAGLYQIP
ncbi:zinc finger protein 213-like [Carassius gibelio]|uniref:zinc finger protein 213-like n=1 Tax=Carassius gibelio TaxID=101364 RepID=UPI002279CF0A|nr:zinc finger protein 213-like [Carassius gibelio]